MKIRHYRIKKKTDDRFLKKRHCLRKVFFAIVLAMLTVMFCGCSEIRVVAPMDDNIYIELDKVTCTTAEAMMRVLEEKNLYEDATDMDSSSFWNKTIGNETMSEYVLDSVKDTLTRYTAALLMADERALYLTDEEIQASQAEANNSLSDLASVYNLEQYGISSSVAADLYNKRAIYEKLCNVLAETATSGITENSTKVIRVSYILIPGNVGSKGAQEVRETIKNSTDFEEAANSLGYTPLMNQTIKRGEVNAQFDEVAFALTDGEISEVVDSKDGYYIVKCEEDYLIDESVANFNKTLSTARKNAFDEAYAEFCIKHKIRYNTDIWNKINIAEL